MKTYFHLGWLETPSSRKNFKSAACQELFLDYLSRIQKFTSASFSPQLKSGFRAQYPGSFLILCDFHMGSKLLSSEALSGEIDKISQNGFKSMHVAIGGADGFTAEDKQVFKPDMIWSFGPMTLPHELAAVVATEQIYRAWSILRNLPYHAGH